MKVAKKDVIRLHYTGKIKETGEIFDTTYEDVAKEAGTMKLLKVWKLERSTPLSFHRRRHSERGIQSS
ncbi:MAG: hypothetical protein PWQ92_1581 [Thermococcaceae archaeon]|nr:hypothetical protein [Thermococcaceae archaeon]